jgi:hypothetical protein
MIRSATRHLPSLKAAGRRRRSMPAAGLERTSVTSFATSGPKSPVIRVIEASTGPARPGTKEMSAIAFAVWMCVAAGAAAAMSRARGGGVKRHAAATQKTRTTRSVSIATDRARRRAAPFSPRAAGRVSCSLLTRARPKIAASRTTLTRKTRP